MKAITRSLVLAALGIVAAPNFANALVLVTTGNTPGGANVLFNNNPPNGTSIVGILNSAPNYNVNFTSTQTLLGNGGQARVEDAGGGSLNNISISLDAPLTFTQLVANSFTGSGNLSITVNSSDGIQVFNPFAPGGLGNGQNFFTVLASGGTAINSVSLSGATFRDLRQTRINGVAGPGGAVPEPGSIALLVGAGIGGLILRRRKK